MSRISAAIKWMPLSYQSFNYILFAACDITIQKANAVTFAGALLNRMIYQLGPPKTLMSDEDRTLSPDVLMYMYNTLYIRSQVISQWNHRSLRTDRVIISISEMLCKPIKTTGEDWAFVCETMLLCIKHICISIYRLLSI